MTKRRTSQRRNKHKSPKKVQRRRSKKKTAISAPMPPMPPMPLIPIRYKKGITYAALFAAVAYLLKQGWKPENAGNIKKFGEDILGALSIVGGPLPPEPGPPRQWNQKIGLVKGQVKWIYDFIAAMDRFKQRVS